MSAIWGCIEYERSKCSVDTMSSEYMRKCKLDKISEKKFGSALIGSGIQIINEEDKYEEMPYVVDGGNVIITADCIIDNRSEIICELSLKDDNIPSGRLISYAYEKWHYDFVKHIKGIFSIAIYNVAENELFICTDRTSSRCLYYYRDNKRAVFSTLISPIKQILPDIPRNELYLKDFAALPGLVPNISSVETPWKGVFIVEAGCSVIISRSGTYACRYYEPVKYDLPDEEELLKKKFTEIYTLAVERASRTSGEVGIALSGGLDSSSVAALAAPILKKRQRKLFSYTFIPYYDVTKHYSRQRIVNETGYVKELAKMYSNIEMNCFHNEGKSFWPYLGELLDVLEIPYKAFVNLPTILEICRKAEAVGCKVFLNGQTGNASISYGNIDDAVYELIRKGRYKTAFKYFNNFCNISNISRKKWFPKEIKKLVSGRNSIQKEITAKQFNPFINSKLTSTYKLSERNISGMIFRAKNGVLKKEDFGKALYAKPALSYIGAMETKLGLYTGVVIRDATRDPDVLDFCMSFPFEYYCLNGVPRYLVRGFLKDIIPHYILYPVLKTGIQNADWIYRLRNEKEEIYKELCCFAHTDEADYFDIERIKGYIEEMKPFTIANEQEYVNLFVAYILDKYLK